MAETWVDTAQTIMVIISSLGAVYAVLQQRSTEARIASAQVKKSSIDAADVLSDSALDWTKQFSVELEKVRGVNQLLESRLESFREDNERLRERVNALEQQNERHKNKIAHLEADNRVLGGKVVILEEERTSLIDRIKILEAENGFLKRELDDIKNGENKNHAPD